MNHTCIARLQYFYIKLCLNFLHLLPFLYVLCLHLNKTDS